MRRNGISAACRTNSLPSRGKVKKCRKVKPRVSFSILPPAKIEFESENESSDNQTSRVTVFNNRVAQFLNEKDRQRSMKYDQCSSGNGTKSPSESDNVIEIVHDLDSVNELLMDIVEEIEAENITVEDCLRDAITLQIIDVEDAKTVLENFEFENVKIETDCNNNSSANQKKTEEEESAPSGVDSYDTHHSSTEKLIDLLSTLETIDLSKCCKYTLGKLCQLTSYEDYENVQKRAAQAQDRKQQNNSQKNENILSDGDSTTSEFPEESSYTDASCISSSSSENFEESSGLGSENEYCIRKDGLDAKLKNKDPSAAAAAIKQALPALLDEGVLKPRQVWGIMGSKDYEEFIRRFMSELSFSLGKDKLREVENDHDFSYNSRINQFVPEDCDSSVFLDLGYCSHPSDRDSPISDNQQTSLDTIDKFRKFSKETNSRPFTITSARSRQNKLAFKTSTPIKFYGTQEKEKLSSEREAQLTCKDYAALISWCKKNELPARTAYILHCNGCDSEEDLLSLNVEQARYFQDLSWNARSRLIIAIESLRLEKQYRDMKNKLERCASILKSVDS